MSLNNMDKGKRICIMCNCNENGICENVTYKRSSNLIKGYISKGNSKQELFNETLTLSKLKHIDIILSSAYQIRDAHKTKFHQIQVVFKDGALRVVAQNKSGNQIPGLTGNNLRYYRTSLIPRAISQKNRRALMVASTDLLCIKNDVYEEQKQFCGKNWKSSLIRYFDDGTTRMLVIYDERAVPYVVNCLQETTPPGKILVYVFSNARYAFEDDFEDVLDKVELCALPAAIYDAYQKVLPPMPEQMLDEEVEDND